MTTLSLRRKEDNEDEKLHKEHKLILERLLGLPENKRCVDCGTAAPRWASASLGVFLCMSCSGVHRSLGTHISFVRSVSLDKWKPEEVKFMQSMGNIRAAEIWEGKLPADYRRPSPHDNVTLERFIRDKYVNKRFYKPPPNNNDNSSNNSNTGIASIPKTPVAVSPNRVSGSPLSAPKSVQLRMSPYTSNVSTSQSIPRSYKKPSQLPTKSSSHQPTSRSALISPTTNQQRPQSQIQPRPGEPRYSQFQSVQQPQSGTVSPQVQPRPGEPRPSQFQSFQHPQSVKVSPQVQPRTGEPRPTQFQSVQKPPSVTVSPRPPPPVETELLFVVDNPGLPGEVNPLSQSVTTPTFVETELLGSIVVPVPVNSHPQPQPQPQPPLQPQLQLQPPLQSQPPVQPQQPLQLQPQPPLQPQPQPVVEPLPSVVDVNFCKKSNIMSMFEQQPLQQQENSTSQEPVYFMQQMYYSGSAYNVAMFSDGHYPNQYLVMQYPQFPLPQHNSQ